MWFSGMRGAVAFALALHMNVEKMENKRMLLTSTLFVVLFSIIFMGGTALPLIKVLDALFPNEEEFHDREERIKRGQPSAEHSDGSSNRSRRRIVLSKTQEMNVMDHGEYIVADYSDCNDTFHHHNHKSQSHRHRKNFFTRLNEKIVRPLLVRNKSKEVSRINLDWLYSVFSSLFRKSKKTICTFDK